MEHPEALPQSGQRRQSQLSWQTSAILSLPVSLLASRGPAAILPDRPFFNPELRAKRVELLKEVMPRLTHVAVILNADNPAVGPEFQAMEKAAQVLDIKLQPFRLREPSELVSAFEKMEQTNVEAVETGDGPLAVANVGAIVALASRARLLSIGAEDVPRAGGIIGYGVDFVAVFRRAGFFVDKILKGTKPADLPIERVSKFQFILNRKAAKALGFELPQSILLRADELTNQVRPRDVRYWPKADMPQNAINVALGSKADMPFCTAYVRL
jgi:putative ABC transport system substrate-binding protein